MHAVLRRVIRYGMGYLIDFNGDVKSNVAERNRA